MPSAKKALARDVLVFSAARLGLVVAIAGLVLGVSALLGATVPLVVALLIAVVAALPLSLLLFQGLRRRVNEGIVVVDAQRRAERERLQARLSGDPEQGPEARGG